MPWTRIGSSHTLRLSVLALLVAVGASARPIRTLCNEGSRASFLNAYEQSNWVGGATGTNCPNWWWLKDYDELYPSNGGVFFDVGCNVGYSSARLFTQFRPETGLTPKGVYEVGTTLGVQGLPTDQTCGACQDCQDDPPRLSHRPNMVIHCYEPSKNHFLRLLLLRARILGGQERRWHLHNAAVSNISSRFANFPAEGCGELCSLDPRDVQGSTSLGFDATLSVTLDSVLVDFPRVHFMKIDTEGHEPTLFEGARHSLLLGKFDIFTFEYHEVGAWARTNLSSVVVSPSGFIGASPYVCFLDGVDSVIPVSGGCFSPEYDKKHWSNVVCVHPRLDKLVDKMMATAREFAARYPAA